MKTLLISLCALGFAFDIDNEDHYEYQATIDPVVQARVLSASSHAAARKLGGVFGLCADGINVPLKGGLVCDPPNALPQICTLVCTQGYYSSGVNKDIACADAMCEGPCKTEPYECVGNQIKFGTRPCSYIRYTNCTDSDSQYCLETVDEVCNYTYYEEVRRPCCNLTQVGEPEGCWTSGCTGNCDSPDVYHYYSTTCADVCPPWQDPPNPLFACSACQVPELPAHAVLVSSNAKGFDPPSEITVGCEDGYWGFMQTSNCMSTDGTFYPPLTLQCSPCFPPTILDGEFVETKSVHNADGIVYRVEYMCINGYVGDSTVSECDKTSGIWTSVGLPYCDIAPSPNSTPSISPTSSISPSSNGFPSESLTQSVSPTLTTSGTPTRTPSVSKSPRPPKVKGSRAPTQPPKIRGV